VKGLKKMTKMLTHDRTHPREVYWAIKEYFPNTAAKDWVPEIIFAFIPEEADAVHWQKVLRDTEYNILNPKPKREKDRRPAGTGPNNKHNNPGRLVISRDLVEN
jgi:hypothetical protein